MSTYFDLDLIEQQHDFVKVFKVSSSDINNVPLLKNIFKKTYNHINHWCITNNNEIKYALKILNLPKNKICLMHCAQLSYRS